MNTEKGKDKTKSKKELRLLNFISVKFPLKAFSLTRKVTLVTGADSKAIELQTLKEESFL